MLFVLFVDQDFNAEAQRVWAIGDWLLEDQFVKFVQFVAKKQTFASFVRFAVSGLRVLRGSAY
ncbi:MAG TPA: hypothetical protein DEF47_09450 [Herpetosiphon sp.]|nr:hypothetical protein [Herpetosiphon sp.]